MHPYICITHASADRTEAERLFDTIVAYGFRCRMLHEASDPNLRTKTLHGAALVLALTSPEASRVETVAADLRRLPERGRAPICISLTEEENSLDERLCRAAGAPSDAHRAIERIPYPTGETPDTQALGLFIHRLFIRHLSRIEGAFFSSRCRRDAYGRVIAMAVLAHRADPQAAYALGCAYERGEGAPVLESEAAAWITRAAEQKLSDALLHLGELCLSGWGVEPDPARAFHLFSSVADTGDVRGEYRLGLCFLNGAGVVADPVRALHHLRRAARWGYAPAIYRLALLFRDGIGTVANPRMALHYFEEACRKGAAAETAYAAKLRSDDRIFEESDTDPVTYEDGDDEGLGLLPEEITTLLDRAMAASRSTLWSEATRMVTYPAPPSLNDPRAARGMSVISMRHLRHRLTGRVPIAETGMPRKAGVHGGAFSTWRYTAIGHPERAWIGSLTRSSHVTAPGGGRASGHSVLYMDRDDVAMGVPFDPSDAALALASLLETGDAASGLSPHPTRALAWYRYALRRGNTEALIRLADAYRQGRGTPPDPVWAVVLYRMAADWGDPRGQFSLAVSCERGIGTETDMAEAIRRYEQAAMAGYAPAQNNLGGCYEYGIGVARNMLTAVEWYVRAAEAGQPEALCRLGLCYECGRGVPTDPARAHALYRKAADLQHPYALYRLGVSCERGLRIDADHEATPQALSHRSPLAEAVAYWQAAAEGGVAEAAYAVSVCYAQGRGVRRDLERAMAYLADAAEGGCLQAVTRMGLCCLEGIGTVRHTVRAVSCFEHALKLWRTRRVLYMMDTAPRPACTHTPLEAIGDALYLLAYDLLEGLEKPPKQADIATCTSRAAALLSEAAELGHVGASTALGDLYAHGRLPAPENTTADAVARAHYERAVRTAALRRGISAPLTPDKALSTAMEALSLPRVPMHDPRRESLLSTAADPLGITAIPALQSLAALSAHAGEACRASGDDEGAARAMNDTWRYLSAAVAEGSVDARVSMAECLYKGYGKTADPVAARKLLQAAEGAPGGRILASLWLGDFLRAGFSGPCLPVEADDAYHRGLTATPIDSEVGPYVLSERKTLRRKEENQARAELLYRLASFRSIYHSDQAHDGHPIEIDRRDTFAYLSEAVLLGHTAAREDLSRMYAYERRYNAATAPAARESGKTADRRRLFGRKKRIVGTPGAMRDHRIWLSDYYTALWPEPRPFRYALRSVALPSHVPAHAIMDVTPLMQAAAMNYLGDCFFYGNGLARRPAAAVTCYREVVETKLDIPRGEPVPESVVWAQYSLGWCLLHGEGVAQNEREAVKWLTEASKSHPEACYALGECHERGIGVNTADLREAVKYYRRALKLGYTEATAKVTELEKILQDRVDNNV